MTGKKRKITIALILVFLALIGVMYVAGLQFFFVHFLPGTTINGIDCSFQTIETSEESLSRKMASYQLGLDVAGGGREVLDAEEIGLVYRKEGSMKELAKAQDASLWFLDVAGTKKHQLTVPVSFDEEKLRKAVDSLQCFQNMVPPKDACIEEKNGTFYVADEVEGNTLSREKVTGLVKEAVLQGQQLIDLEENGCYERPRVYGDSPALAEEADRLNRCMNTVIYYDFGDREEVVDSDIVRSWLVRNEKGSFSFDEAAMAAYLAGLAQKYDTLGIDRQFITAFNETITVRGGDYGYVIDQEKTLTELKAALEGSQSGVREPVYEQEGFCRDTDDIGDTFVEINLTEQRMFFYKEGKLLVDTPVVTGNPERNGGTPTGCYSLDEKKSPAIVKGETYRKNKSGEVTYWLPFSGEIGIHDCGDWRERFGGQIYLKNGSKGCVNAPYEAVEAIYRNIETGTPVIIHP